MLEELFDARVDLGGLLVGINRLKEDSAHAHVRHYMIIG